MPIIWLESLQNLNSTQYLNVTFVDTVFTFFFNDSERIIFHTLFCSKKLCHQNIQLRHKHIPCEIGVLLTQTRMGYLILAHWIPRVKNTQLLNTYQLPVRTTLITMFAFWLSARRLHVYFNFLVKPIYE